jgi:hypothetical protein
LGEIFWRVRSILGRPNTVVVEFQRFFCPETTPRLHVGAEKRRCGEPRKDGPIYCAETEDTEETEETRAMAERIPESSTGEPPRHCRQSRSEKAWPKRRSRRTREESQR